MKNVCIFRKKRYNIPFLEDIIFFLLKADTEVVVKVESRNLIRIRITQYFETFPHLQQNEETRQRIET